MKKIIFTLLAISPVLSFCQTFEWASQIVGATTNTGYDITTDAAGNVYVAGQFSGYTDFDPTAGTFGMTSVGIFDAFAAKYSSAGNLLWAVQVGGAAGEGAIARGITLDNDGNVLIIGDFTGTADFDPSAATANLTSFSNDVFICKLTSGGAYVWAKQIGGGSAAYGVDIATDSDGNVYSTGTFQNTTDFDPGAGTYNLNAINGDAFLSKLNADGDFAWAFPIGGSTGDGGNCVYINEMNHVFLSGSFGNTVDFDPSGDAYNLTSAGGSDAFLMKIDADATLIWAVGFGGLEDEYAYNIATDSDGNAYLTGLFEGTTDFDPGAGVSDATANGGYDIYLSKFSASGNFLWSRQMGGLDYDYGMYVDLDADGNVYLGGMFRMEVDFDPSAATVNLTSNGGYDIYIEKFDTDGNFISVQVFGGVDPDKLNALHIDADATIFATGEFNNSVDFDPNAGTVTLTSTGQQDTYILKLKQNSSSINESILTTIELYPNPAQTELTISTTDQIIEIVIYNIAGECVLVTKDAQFSVSHLQAGTYYLTVQTDKEMTPIQFVKM